jgi:hypothetical protein
MECVVVQDLFLNETAKYAHVFLPGLSLPGEGRHLHQRRAPHQPRAQGDAAAGRLADWEVTQNARQRAGLPDALRHPVRDHGRDRALTPTFAGVSYAKLDELGRCSGRATSGARGHAIMHVDGFVRGKGASSSPSTCRPTSETRPALPAAADHRPHPQPVQRRRADAAHRQHVWHDEDRAGDPPARRREARHPRRRLGAHLASRAGETDAARRHVTERMQPGVVYTTFHFPESRRQRHHHRLLRLGHQLPRVQGDRGREGLGQAEALLGMPWAAEVVAAMHGGRDRRPRIERRNRGIGAQCQRNAGVQQGPEGIDPLGPIPPRNAPSLRDRRASAPAAHSR